MNYLPRHKTPPANTNLVAYCPDFCEDSYVICTYDEGGFRFRGSNAIDKYVTHYAVLEEME